MAVDEVQVTGATMEQGVARGAASPAAGGAGAEIFKPPPRSH